MDLVKYMEQSPRFVSLFTFPQDWILRISLNQEVVESNTASIPLEVHYPEPYVSLAFYFDRWKRINRSILFVW